MNMFKKGLFLFGLFFLTSVVYAWFPSSTSHSLRLKASGTPNDFYSPNIFQNLDIEGQIFSKGISKKGLKMGTLYSLSSENHKNKLGGYLSYPVNEFVEVSVNVDVNSKANWASGFCLHSFIPHKYKGFSFIYTPFVQINTNRLSGAGIVVNIEKKNISFDVGIGFKINNTHIKEFQNFDFRKDATVSLLVGTSLDNINSF